MYKLIIIVVCLVLLFGCAGSYPCGSDASPADWARLSRVCQGLDSGSWDSRAWCDWVYEKYPDSPAYNPSWMERACIAGEIGDDDWHRYQILENQERILKRTGRPLLPHDLEYWRD